MKQKYRGADVASRLHGTIIRYKGQPVSCMVEDSSGSISLHSLSTGDLIARVDADDDNLDISSLPLGYVNLVSAKAAVYLKREPLRRYKQGVEVGYLTQKALNEEGNVGLRNCASQGLVDCVMGKYPTLESAMTMFTKNSWRSVAVSRDVALRRVGAQFTVYVKDDEAGTMRLGTTTCVIKRDELSWVNREILELVPGLTVIEE